jgi:hypothetical protein
MQKPSSVGADLRVRLGSNAYPHSPKKPLSQKEDSRQRRQGVGTQGLRVGLRDGGLIDNSNEGGHGQCFARSAAANYRKTRDFAAIAANP